MAKKPPEEGLYSRVTRRIWKSTDFLALSKPKPSGRELWLRLLIAPETDRIPGLFAAYQGGLADAMEWPLKDLQRCWKEIDGRKMAFADWKVGLVWVPNALRHSFPPNPNNVTGWRLTWKDLPDCALKERARVFMATAFETEDRENPTKGGDGWAVAFSKATRTGNPPSQPGTETLGGNPPPQRGGDEREGDGKGEGDPPYPPHPAQAERPRPRDPMGSTFLPIATEVARVHERWQAATGLTGHRLKGPTSIDAITLREAIDVHGEVDCLLVAEACMRDRMVNGQADERGSEHKSIGYVFGNETAFARILKAAQEAKPKAAESAADPFEAAIGARAS